MDFLFCSHRSVNTLHQKFSKKKSSFCVSPAVLVCRHGTIDHHCSTQIWKNLLGSRIIGLWKSSSSRWRWETWDQRYWNWSSESESELQKPLDRGACLPGRRADGFGLSGLRAVDAAGIKPANRKEAYGTTSSAGTMGGNTHIPITSTILFSHLWCLALKMWSYMGRRPFLSSSSSSTSRRIVTYGMQSIGRCRSMASATFDLTGAFEVIFPKWRWICLCGFIFVCWLVDWLFFTCCTACDFIFLGTRTKKTHLLDSTPSESVECEKEDLIKMFELMYTMRRIKKEFEKEYRGKKKQKNNKNRNTLLGSIIKKLSWREFKMQWIQPILGLLRMVVTMSLWLAGSLSLPSLVNSLERNIDIPSSREVLPCSWTIRKNAFLVPAGLKFLSVQD